jgi:hypothetical protein
MEFVRGIAICNPPDIFDNAHISHMVIALMTNGAIHRLWVMLGGGSFDRKGQK